MEKSNNIHPENCGDSLAHQQHLGIHPEVRQVSTETDEEKGDSFFELGKFYFPAVFESKQEASLC
ncbi:hypothetical protein LCGC14_0441880 [marine sediment metagenome]|uniref:Uncharacterized protein n=1 Tax=marine sediment metagenome TaxID=412755 RepID=A0A0F9SR39_9ZZZZ